MGTIHENMDKYNLKKKCKILIIFDMIADILIKKNLQSIADQQLFFRSRKMMIWLTFITQSHFLVPKNMRLNSTHYFIMKISSKQFHQITVIHFPGTDFKDFIKFYKNYPKKPYYFFVNNATLPAGSPLHFRCNLLERI